MFLFMLLARMEIYIPLLIRTTFIRYALEWRRLQQLFFTFADKELKMRRFGQGGLRREFEEELLKLPELNDLRHDNHRSSIVSSTESAKPAHAQPRLGTY